MVLKHIPNDALEWGIDHFTENELVKSLPVVSTVVSLYGTAKDISNHLFMKKLQSFLNSLDLQTGEDIEKMRACLGNEKEKQDIGERLLLILNASTEMEKSALMAKVFRAYVDKKIEKQDLDNIWNILDKCYLEQLKEYVHMEYIVEPDVPNVLPLAAHGLFSMPSGVNWAGIHYNKTDFGFFVCYILFDIPIPDKEKLKQDYLQKDALKNADKIS